MKKIAILHPAHYEQIMGGAELQISYLIKYFAQCSYEIHFIFIELGGPISSRNNVELYPVKKINIKKKFGQTYFLYKKRLEKHLNDIKPDLIYTRTYSSWSGIAAHYAFKEKVKHIWAIASNSDVERKWGSRLLRKPLDIIEILIVRKSFKFTSIIITQNNYQAINLLKRYNRRSTKILQMSECVDAFEIRKPKNKIEIVWIGNLKPLKQPEYFIKVANIFKSYKNVEFIMIGRFSEDYSQIIERASLDLNNFNYLGELSNEQVNNHLCRAHLLINTSKYEGFSNTFVQAWMRKVVVLSMNSNPDKILTEKNIGFVCPTVTEFVDTLKILISDKKLRNLMAQNAYNYSNEYHTIEKNMKKILNLVQDNERDSLV